MAVIAPAALMPDTGLPASANPAMMPNIGRKVAARWPMVPAVEAATISPASGLASPSSRLMTWNVLISAGAAAGAAPTAAPLPLAEAVSEAG